VRGGGDHRSEEEGREEGRRRGPRRDPTLLPRRLAADANILVNTARLAAQRHLATYAEPVPVEQLVRSLCDAKQGYTQFGGLRPYGVSLLYAGWDCERGFSLYQSDPSGNYSGWKAAAVGANAGAALNILRSDYDESVDLAAATRLAVRVLSKTMDSTALDPQKVELATVTRTEGGTAFRIWDEAELKPLLEEVNAAQKKEKDKEDAKPK